MPLHDGGVGSIFHGFVADTVEEDVSVPFAGDEAGPLDGLVVLDALETFLFVEGEDSFNCWFGYFKDASGQVGFSYFLFVLVKFLFILADCVFKVGAAFLFKCVASACEQKGSVSKHDSSQLYFWHSDEVFCVVLIDFDLDGGGQFGLG